MLTVSIGGITPKGLSSKPRFYYHAYRCYRQAKKNSACLTVKLTRAKGKFFVFSVWTDSKSMQTFARSGAHKLAYSISRDVMSTFDNFSYEAASAPTAAEAIKKWFDQSTDP